MRNYKPALKIAFLVTVTALIIAIGMGIPFLLLSRKSLDKNLPKGTVDIAKVQPYGAAAIENERNLIKTVTAYQLGGFNTYDDSWKILKANDYADLGIELRRFEEGSSQRPEAVSVIIDTLEDNFEYDFQNSFSAIKEKNNNGDELIKIYNEYGTVLIYVDPQTGLPVYMSFQIISDSYEGADRTALDNIVSEIINLYSEYSGISFVHEEGETEYYYRDGYDSTYLRVITTSDNSLGLVFDLSSGWYWMEPQSDEEEWQETDSFIWTINISLVSYGDV